MGIVLRQSVKYTIVTFTGALLGLIVVYASQKLIPQQELGFSRNLLNQAVICSQAILMGVHTTLYVFIFRYADNDEKRRTLITFSLLIPFILTLLFSLLYFAFKSPFIHLYQAKDMAFARQYFAWLPVYTLLWGLMTVLEHYLAAQMKVALSNFMREVILRMLNIALILLYGYGVLSFTGFITYSVLVHLVPVIILYYVANQSGDIRFSINFRAFDRSEYKAIFDFAFFHLLLNVSISLLLYIDSVMLAWLDKDGLESVAVYFIAVSVLSIYQIPYKALAAAATPMLNKAYESGNMHEVKDLFKRSAINTLIATLGKAVLIISNIHNIESILEKQYQSIGYLIMILMIGRTIDMATGLNNELLSVSKYYRYNFYLTIALLTIIVTLNIWLIPRYGVYGAAISAAIGLVAFNIGKMWLLWSKMRLQPFSGKSLLATLACVITFSISSYLPRLQNELLDATYRSILVFSIYLFVVFLLRVSPDLNKYLSDIKNKRRIY